MIILRNSLDFHRSSFDPGWDILTDDNHDGLAKCSQRCHLEFGLHFLGYALTLAWAWITCLVERSVIEELLSVALGKSSMTLINLHILVIKISPMCISLLICVTAALSTTYSPNTAWIQFNTRTGVLL
jgi:hypothetical protein